MVSSLFDEQNNYTTFNTDYMIYLFAHCRQSKKYAMCIYDIILCINTCNQYLLGNTFPMLRCLYMISCLGKMKEK